MSSFQMQIARTRMIRCMGGAVKFFGFLIHAVFPKKRFAIPLVSKARITSQEDGSVRIPRIIWQTNFTEKFTFPVYVNYLFNRKQTPSFEHRFVGDDAQEKYIREHASERTYKAYQRLTDGAAKADLWRLVVLYNEGGVYMDIDATLVCDLERMLVGRENLFILNYDQFSQFFMATVPRHPLFVKMIERVVDNIENYSSKERKLSVFHTTGPGAIADLLPDSSTWVSHKLVSVQGAFTSEYFQYMDRPGTKWIHKKSFID